MNKPALGGKSSKWLTDLRKKRTMGHYIAWRAELGQDEEDGRRITAWDEEMAAREWAEAHDQRSAEYSIASGTDMVVTVKDIESGEVSLYTVSGYSVPAYSARKVEASANVSGEPGGTNQSRANCLGSTN